MYMCSKTYPFIYAKHISLKSVIQIKQSNGVIYVYFHGTYICKRYSLTLYIDQFKEFIDFICFLYSLYLVSQTFVYCLSQYSYLHINVMSGHQYLLCILTANQIRRLFRYWNRKHKYANLSFFLSGQTYHEHHICMNKSFV